MPSGRHRAAGGAGEQPQHEVREENGQQDEEQRDGGSRQLADQATPENHDGWKILTFIRRFVDNGRD